MEEVGDSVLGVSFHSDNYAKQHNIDGTNEVMKNMNHEKPVGEVFFETCVLRMKKLPSTDNHTIFHTTTNIAAVCKC